ncbi:MAG: hypothetical protein PHQ83_03480 [Eubacteriales bacterium]|nr:hypothetical protein [Eubacteriales bacterium]
MPKTRCSCHIRKGSIVLEAALALPPVLFLIALFLHGLILEQEKIPLTRAVDRAAAEIALVLPVSDVSQDWLEDSLSSLVLEKAGLGDLLEPLEPDLSGELSEWAGALATTGLQDFARARISHWLRREGVSDHKIAAAQLEIHWEKDKHLAWLVLTQENPRAGLMFRTTIRSVIPLWQGHPADEAGSQTNETETNIWDLDNFSRGQAIRGQFAANLPDDFPVIAIWQNGAATAIHSIDLTAPTYQDRDEVARAVIRRLNLLAAFTGADYSRQEIRISIAASQITSRRLILVIPGNSSQDFLAEVLTELDQKARAMGIILAVERFGESGGFSGQAAPQPAG